LERLGALDGLDAEEVKAVGVGLFPLFAGQKVVLVGGRQVRGDLAKVGILTIAPPSSVSVTIAPPEKSSAPGIENST